MRCRIVGAIVLVWLGVGCTFAGNDDGEDDGGDDGEEPVPPPDDPMPPPPEPTGDLLQLFSGCPVVSDLVEVEFAEKWAQLGDDGGSCGSCHIDARSGYEPILADAVTALDQMTTSADRIRVFFAVVGDDVVLNGALVRASSGDPPFVAHPHFDLEETGALGALEAVYANAHARYLGETCGPPRY